MDSNNISILPQALRQLIRGRQHPQRVTRSADKNPQSIAEHEIATSNLPETLKDAVRRMFDDAPDKTYTANAITEDLRKGDGSRLGILIEKGCKLIAHRGRGEHLYGSSTLARTIASRSTRTRTGTTGSGSHRSHSSRHSSRSGRQSTVLSGRVGDAQGDSRSASSRSSNSARTPVFIRHLKARQGGRNTCEMTGAPGPDNLEASHIFPIACLNPDRKYEPLWELLNMFWKSGDVNTLRNAIGANVNNIANGTRLKVDAHGLFDSLRLYLSVDWTSVDANVGTNSNQYRVTFKWQRPEAPPAALLVTYWEPGAGEIGGNGRRQISAMDDGDSIILKTSDPTEFPLPDPYLLEIRALLTKVALPKAGGGSRDYSSDESDLDLSVGCDDSGLKQQHHDFDSGQGHSVRSGQLSAAALAENEGIKPESATTRTKRWVMELPRKRRRSTSMGCGSEPCEIKTKRPRL